MSDMLKILQKLIRRAGKAVQECAQGYVTVKYKEDYSPVTNADITSHKILVDGLADFGYPILSEEGIDSTSRFESEWVWLVDPLDGTKDFLKKTGEYSVIIGLIHKGEPVLGLVYQPAVDILYYAEKEAGAFLQEKNGTQIPLRVSDHFNDITMWISRHHSRLKEQQLVNRLGIHRIIPCGSIGLKASLIASGRGELYVNFGNKCCEWDTCAAEIIVTEAGGMMTDLDGKRIQYNKKSPINLKGVVITNGKLHNKVIEKLRNI